MVRSRMPPLVHLGLVLRQRVAMAPTQDVAMGLSYLEA